MKINKVYLKDYRIHVNNEFEFDNGINLILGKNGSGKSSILEAIGLALFDADIRSSNDDSIRYGQKSSLIRVEFEGNDGNTYLVERKIGVGASFKLYLKGDTGPRLEGKDPVLSKIKELAGIQTNAKNIFQNVIMAYQNQIVNLFSQTPGDRAKIFNQIFDTDIYRDMFEKFLKQARETYVQSLTLKQQLLADKKSRLKDTDELTKSLAEKTRTKKNEEKKLIALNKEIDLLGKKLNKLEILKSAIENNSKEQKHKKELMDSKAQELSKAMKSLSESQEALKTKMERESEFLLYDATNKDLKKISEEIENLEKKEQRKNRLKEELNLLAVKEKEDAINRKNLLKDIDSKQNELVRIEAETTKLQDEYDALNAEVQNIVAIVEQRQILYESYEKKHKEYASAGKKLTEMNQALELMNKKKIDTITAENEILRFQNNKESLLEKLKEKHAIESTIKELEARLHELEAAEESLRTGMCPILIEECSNIKQKGSTPEYFTERKKEMSKAVEHAFAERNRYGTIEQLIVKTDTDSAILRNKIKEDEKTRTQIQLIQKDAQIALKEMEMCKLVFKDILRPVQRFISEELITENFDRITLYLSNELATLREKLKAAHASADEKSARLNKRVAEKTKLDAGIRDSEKTTAKLAQKIEQNRANASTKGAVIAKLEEELADLQGLRENRKSKNSTLAHLKQSYDLYIGSVQKAGELKVHQKNSAALEKDITQLNRSIEKLETRHAALIADYSEQEYQETVSLVSPTKQAREEMQKILSALAIEIDHAERELKENQQGESECRLAETGIRKLEQKLELADIFRNKVEGMGKYVAARLMDTIRIVATQNYRNITGRSEEIEWITTEYEKAYTVYLVSGEGAGLQRRRFEMLSGGEQVAVALSLRAAMASMLTSTNFVIFDEPTINLDAERKQALADSLRGMMQDLTQAIIVTHDETFREMAQKIIMLDE